MDGFAMRSGDTESADSSVRLRVTGTVQAGAGTLPTVGEGEAVRIMTGAPLPPGADAVVPFEETEIDGDFVAVPSGRVSRSCVRPAGLDVRRGDHILTRGCRLAPAHIALAASVGADQLSVIRRPEVAILATGDELVEVGDPLEPGQIYNSNAHGLRAAVAQLGAVPHVLAPARDDASALRESLVGLRNVDLVLSSGGVSVGDFDYVKTVVEEIGNVNFWRVCMRPGKPLMVASLSPQGGPPVPMLGLPGNPTSTMVTFFVFARPLILKLLGSSRPFPQPVVAEAREELDNRGGRETYFRAVLELDNAGPSFHLAGGQDSSMLAPLARANALARVPADVETVKIGDRVDVLPLESP